MNVQGRSTFSRVATEVAKKLRLDAVLRPIYRRWTTTPRVVTLTPLGLSYKLRLDPQELCDYEAEFEHGERDFLEVLKNQVHAGETLLDVGAHFGEFTLPLAGILGETGSVLAFEPDERAYPRLLDHIKLKGLTNVHTFKKALGEADSEGTIYFGGGFCPTMVPLEDDATRRSASANISIVHGDAFFQRENLPIPHAVKIDVEGFEYAVLRGLRGTLASPTCRLICLEVHPEVLPPGVSPETIADLLRSFGFGEIKIEQRTTEIHMVAMKPAHAPE